MYVCIACYKIDDYFIQVAVGLLAASHLTHSLTHSFFADFVHRLSGKMNEIFSSSSTAAAAAAAAGGGCVVRAFSEFGGAQN